MKKTNLKKYLNRIQNTLKKYFLQHCIICINYANQKHSIQQVLDLIIIITPNLTVKSSNN